LQGAQNEHVKRAVNKFKPIFRRLPGHSGR
jgi:hypothetical protein